MDGIFKVHLVKDNNFAIKLISAWPVCFKDSKDDWIKTSIPNVNKYNIDEYRSIANMLIKMKICSENGDVDEFVKKYLSAMAAKSIGKVKN